MPNHAERLHPVLTPSGEPASAADGDFELLVEIAQQEFAVRLGHGRANQESRDAWRMHHSLKSDSSPAVIARSAPSDCDTARSPAASTR